MKTIFYEAFFFCIIFISCIQSKSKHITEFSQSDIKNGILIDLRTPEEYGLGHLHKASNANFLDSSFLTYFDTISKSKTIYLYCKKGSLSTKAAHKLDSLGYTAVNLLGGYNALEENNN